MLLAASVAMLTACAASVSDAAQSAPDPVIETRTVTVRVCPAELRAALPPRAEAAADAVLSGNEAGMAWLNALLARLGLVEARLADAAKECP